MNTTNRLKLILFFCTLVMSSYGQQDFPGLDTAIQRIIKQTEFLGATILVAKGEKIVHHKGYGIAHPGFNVPVTTETKYFIQGPDGIVFVGLVMKFAEEKKLDLNDKIKKYLTNLPSHYNDITIKQLLTSTSGIIDYHYLGDPFDATLYTPKSRDEAMARFIDMPLTQAPGSGFDWSISNFSVMCAILEKIDGRSYAVMLKEFLAPLQLKNTGSLKPGKVISNFTNGYEYDSQNEEYKQITHSLFSYDPVFSLYSTAEESFLFCRAISNGTLISKESYALMTSREEARKNNSGEMGYQIFLENFEGHEVLSTGGGLAGYTGAWRFIPTLNATIIVLSNSWGSSQHAFTLNSHITRYLLGLPALPKSTQNQLQKAENITVDVKEAARVSGTYLLSRTSTNPAMHRSFNYFKRTVRVFKENGQLLIQYLGELPEPLLLQKDGSYRISAHSGSFRFTNVTSNDQELVIDYKSYTLIDKGKRIGNADVKTFYGTLNN